MPAGTTGMLIAAILDNDESWCHSEWWRICGCFIFELIWVNHERIEPDNKSGAGRAKKTKLKKIKHKTDDCSSY